MRRMNKVDDVIQILSQDELEMRIVIMSCIRSEQRGKISVRKDQRKETKARYGSSQDEIARFS